MTNIPTPPVEPDPEHSEGRFRLLVQGVRDYAIFMLDPSGKVLTWNAGAELLKGYKADEIIGQHFSRFYPQEALDRNFPHEELVGAAKHGRFEDEGWRIRKDGSRFWANVVITALRNESGELQGFGKVTRDLTNRRAAEDALRQSEERFRLLVEAVSEYALFMLDVNGHIATWNAGAERLKGYEADEIIGKHFRVFYPKDTKESGWPEHELDVARAEGRFEDEGWRVRKDGSRFWANVVITALRDSDGQLQGFAKLTRDLTERQKAQTLIQEGVKREELLDAERNARIAAQRATRIKDEFLAILSHELRTPLNAILGWTQVLQLTGGAKVDEVKKGVQVIDRSARAQLQLVEDLLDISRIMAGRIRLDVQQVTLADMVRSVVDSAEPSAQTKNIRIEAVLDPNGGVVGGDPGRLQQVFWNLVSNAIKFTPKGGKIQVVLQRVNSHIEVSVSDTGIGIEASFLPYVFDRFSQEDSSTTRRHGGLGLGLAISKQLVELHGGSIHAKSMGENKGSTFVVHLPLIMNESGKIVERAHPTTPVTDEAVPVPELNGMTVLVVDDEWDSIDLIRRVLETRGAKVIEAQSAQEALVKLERTTPDVIVSDIGMPDMDGYEFIRRWRAGEARGRKIPALALTAFARPNDRKRAIVAGYQAHLAKPFDLAELTIVIAGLVGRT